MSTISRTIQIGLALLALLALTVGAARVNLGPWNTFIAMAIALAKAALIALFFMRLRRQSPLIKLFACAGVFWLGILIALTMSDYLTR